MKRLLSIILLIAWSLWFGGGVALLMFVTRLFRYDRSVAVAAAPQMFLLFERYHLVLGAIALPCAVALRVCVRSRACATLPALLAAGFVIAIVSATWLTPAINNLRVAGQSSSPEFRRLHAFSSIAYLLELLILLCAGIILPAILSHRSDFPAKGTSS